MSKRRIVVLAVIAFTVVIVAGMLLTSCGREPRRNTLDGTLWQVRSYYNPANIGGMASPLGGTELTAKFENDVVSGSAGCNSYSAGYNERRDSLSIDQAAVTMMFCGDPPGIMEQEQAFLAAMQSASSFKLEEEQLHILNDKGQVVVDLVPTDGSWERIKAAGKIVVGTSVDYPPFESYVGPGQIDGFDIALIDEIGRRLGVQIEYQDIAFDGLGPALLQGQVDVAIAAISQTPEREVFADFTNVYLVGEGAALAQQASNITLAAVEDVAKYKTGVQRKSVYEQQIQSNLIDTGQMSPTNFFVYAKPEHAVGDLLAGRIELVILDSQPAQAFVEQGGVKIVGIGVNQQYYAIALPRGAASLKAKLDETITSLYNDGTIASLSERYLGTAELLPTPTPGPTSVPAPTPSCVDGLALVKHLTTEGDMQPGQAFTKGWQVQNSGTCPWTTGYRLVFADGDKMGGEPVAVARQVNSGETYDMQVSLVAPLEPGDYRGVWQMVNAQGVAFGERLEVTIRVLAVPTVTPQPTQTPSPFIKFEADRYEIKAGECVVFTWSVQNVKEVYFYAEGEAWQDHGVAGEGSSTECPPVTTTYYLRVVYTNNTVDVREITIYVEPAPAAPQITRFTVDPAGQITLGQCVTIRWEVGGDVDRVKLFANGNVLWDPAPTTGNTQDCPTAAGTVAYVLEAVGPGGTSRQQNNLNVVAPATATPAPTPEPEAPAIYSFVVSPNQIQAGECAGVSWSVGGGTTYARIVRNEVVIVDDAGYTGQVMDCLDTPGSYTYLLQARNNAGQEVTQQQSVNVTEAAPVNPLANTRWQVTTLANPATGLIGPVLPGTTLTMDFSAGGELNGSSGCNTYSSTYQVSGSQLSITTPVGTGMFCETPAGIMEQEQVFLGLMQGIGSFKVEGNTLTLLSGSGLPVVILMAY